MTQKEFLERYIYDGLENLNDGFDAPGIKYFSKKDFAKVLKRVEKLGIGIYGIEPWPNKVFWGVKTYEESEFSCTDPRWYNSAFQQMIDKGVDSCFAASYFIPEELLKSG